jgi:hypothetical protein
MSPLRTEAIVAPNGKGQANGANSSTRHESFRGGVDNDQYDSADLPEQSTLTFSTDAPMTIGPMAGGSKHRGSINDLDFEADADPPPYDSGSTEELATTNRL